MEKTVQQNLKISGSGSASGGVYNHVNVNGSGKITGDIECDIFSCNGSSNVKGNVKAESVKVNGSANIEGNMDAHEVSINGSSDIDGNVNCKEIKIQGSASIKGELKAKEIYVRGTSSVDGNVAGDEIEIRGQVKIKGDCEAESFNSRGNFSISGLLNAGHIDIELLRHCEAKEIGGEHIVVRKTNDSTGLKKLIKYFVSQNDDSLSADVIEGDHVYLEYTQAKVVRGNTVEIGPGCKIENIEYKESLEIDENAKVGKQQKI
ncbi:polymer-forming cytoskeletal protein [Bacillus sp. NEB1478]|uniref:polymer-forming cytoskeletal protein n=1 Tax=Bacillus sp. NEB1478 TaxID=3073816 RepID=UPI002873CE70|nr:polymer-forming cytoskeletal protein [Bacillus sp. NEB1478]WNB91490.1 polymer-forming cytoskeletal protein [Bacillus sp. NEB1478]